MEFQYTARTATGSVVRGNVTSSNTDAAFANLRRRALFVTAMRERPQTERAFTFPTVRIGGGRATIAFFRSFATLVRAGVPLQRGMGVVIERCESAVLKAALRDVALAIERGDQLSTAFARHPRAFSALTVAMVAAGESGGILDAVLDRIAGFLERDSALRKSVTSALAYPVVVLGASLLLVAFLIVRVVPMFSALFASFHVPLPVSTRVLMAVGDAASQPAVWSAAIVSTVLFATAAVALMRTQRGRLAFDRVRLHVPIGGAILRKTIVARFARMTGTLVHSGIELSAALDIVRPVTGSPVHEAALAHVCVALREGDTFTAPLAASGVFDPMLIALVGVGEETGMLDVMLPKAAEYFEADVAAAISTLSAVVEPALIGILGIIVGLIMYAVFIPLYSLIGSVSQ